jgi:kynurenine formamidase
MCVPGTLETVRDRMEREGPPRVSRRVALAAGAGAMTVAALPGTASAGGRGRHFDGNRRRRRLVDLTHEFRDDFPTFPGVPPTSRMTAVTIPANGFYGQVWTIWEHICTHMDVPAHFVEGGRTSPEMTLDELVAPIVVVDISGRVAREPDTVVTPEDLERFERRHGRIPKGAVVAMYSGWETRAGSVEAYRNTDATGTMRFPGFGKEAVDWLLERRRIRGIGVDTMSLDHGSSSTFDVHLTVLSADRYGVENLRNLREIPARGATVVLGLIPWREGSGGACRAFALTR